MATGTSYQGYQEFSLQAKVIVLGDPKTGKSSLIHNLDPHNRAGHHGNTGFVSEDIIFSVVEFPISEIIDTTANGGITNSLGSPNLPAHRSSKQAPSNNTVYLKIWEYTEGVTKEEEELAFRGALFCIITLDLRSPETAQNAFGKWLTLKEKHMNESFLFIVGTFVDFTVHRRVDISDMCRSCAQHEAIYTEVSNYDGSNIHLMRRLLAQRIQYMIQIRDSISMSTDGEGGGSNADKRDDLHFDSTGFGGGLSSSSMGVGAGAEDISEETRNHDHDKTLQSLDGPIHAPFLEQDIVCDSIGSILASCIGSEYWPGMEAEAELEQIGKKLSGFIDKLTTDPKSLPKAPLEHSLLALQSSRSSGLIDQFESMWTLGGGVEGESLYETPETDIDELRHVFEVMGFALPSTLTSSSAFDVFESELLPSPSSMMGPGISTPSSNPAAKHTHQAKLRVRLPNGSSTTMTIYPNYPIDHQVDAFLVQHSMEEDSQAREKLIIAARNSLQDANSSRLPELTGQGGQPLMTPVKSSSSAMSTTKATLPSTPMTTSSVQPLVSTPLKSGGSATVSAGGTGSAATNPSTLGGAPSNSNSLTNSTTKSPVSTLGNSTGINNTPLTPSDKRADLSASLQSLPSTKKKLATSSQPKKARKCRVRIQLPDYSGDPIETIVKEGEDLLEVSKTIAAEHGLSVGYQQKVFDQLRAAFKQ